MTTFTSWLDESRHRNYCWKDFSCTESTECDEGRTHVVFSCGEHLTFVCPDPSNGVLHKEELSVVLSEEKAVDPHFFAPNYGLAASTGFSIWPGSRFLAECLLLSQPNDCALLRALQQQLSDNNKHTRILELGAGVGLVGMALASFAHAHDLQTDLPVLTEHAIQVNQHRNSAQTDEKNDRPKFLQPYQALPIDSGWVGSCVVDWTVGLKEQLVDAANTIASIDLVVACDCLWLKHLVEPILDCIEEVFKGAADEPMFVCTYQNRGSNSMYSDLPSIQASIENRQWKLDCLAWHVVDCGDHHTNDLMVLLIAPKR